MTKNFCYKTVLHLLLMVALVGATSFTTLQAQASASLKGKLQTNDGAAVEYAGVALHQAKDSSLYKAAITDESGAFMLPGLAMGDYFLKVSYLGMQDYEKSGIAVVDVSAIDLGIIKLSPKENILTEAVVSAQRPLVEKKADRTTFNVSGTLNSAGNEALALLRKAPNVMVDNNQNISVLGRSGVLVYVDGKRLPLAGDDLTNYLQSLPSEQIDRIDIITNPGAKYEAQGNAGIIDIRLKKDTKLGANGSLNSSYSQGRYHRVNLGGTGNYRNKKVNIFGNANIEDGKRFNHMVFDSYLNTIVQNEINRDVTLVQPISGRFGMDYFLTKTKTIGFLASGGYTNFDADNYNRIVLSRDATPNMIDSILVSENTIDRSRMQQTYNLNYRYDNKGKIFNIDVDYGKYNNKTIRNQPNLYYDADEQNVLTTIINRFDTPSDIDIYTFQTDYENKWLGGQIGFGAKLSHVVSDNTFLVYDVEGNQATLDNALSNNFNYKENVYAAYVNYNRQLTKKLSGNFGLRAEQTDVTGDLRAYLPSLQEPPVEQNYLSWFPNIGLNYQINDKDALNISAGRRINRPDYHVLNPFNNRLSELSIEKGNPRLQPEIVNNAEIGYTLNYMYNFAVGYSLTTNQITRLIGPDDSDPRATFINWDNLAEQRIWSANASAPIQIAKKWSAFTNIWFSHMHNEADYGGGAVVDISAFTYGIYQQHTIELPWKLKGEISGYYSGPGIWGGVFAYESSWSLDLGLQRRFLQDRLNVRISGSDLFYESGWDGISIFDGLTSAGGGRWDSRRATISLGYNFGNQNVKTRKRTTGIEKEAGRTGKE